MDFGVSHDFGDLKRWLSDIPDQEDGDPAAICQTGEPYVEIYVTALARPADIAPIEHEVAREARKRLSAYFNGKSGTIYWRMRPECVVEDAEVVEKYDNNGPDTDTIVDRKCFKDKNWKRVSFYCRLFRAGARKMESRA